MEEALDLSFNRLLMMIMIIYIYIYISFSSPETMKLRRKFESEKYFNMMEDISHKKIPRYSNKTSRRILRQS